MNFFDLHCDSLFESYEKKQSIKNGNLCVNFDRISKFNRYVGCFAIWIPDYLDENQSFDFFKKVNRFFEENKEDIPSNSEIILTVEGSKLIGNDLSRIKFLKEKNVKIITLTWNSSCRIGDGCFVKNPKGLSDFGRLAIKEMEKNNIIVDISHASEKLFYDVLEIAENPVIATHSNSKAVFNHVRNLSDRQFEEIVKNKGIVGVNLCEEFLSKNSPSLNDIFMHIEHFLSLSGENTLCIGTDFDGCKTPKKIKNVSQIPILYEYLLKKNYPEKIVDKIFFNNAKNFFRKQNILNK